MKPYSRKFYFLASIVLMLALIATGCAANAEAGKETNPTDSVQTEGGARKVFWVDSYNADYAWSMAVEAGLRDAFNGSDVELEVFRLDTKNITDKDERAQMAEKAKARIEAFGPDVLIASDDNAQKMLIVPYYLNSDLPVVFCCVNWDASEYNYPASNVTGMIEVDLVQKMVEMLQPYAKGNKIGYLSGDADTDRKIVPIYNERFFDGQMEAVFVKTFDEFKEMFVQFQDEVDILYFGNNQGIEGWDDDEAEAFILQNTKIPTGSRSDWMAPFVLVTVAKLGQEQGVWSAEAALRILNGESVSAIPMAENKQGELYLNFKIADHLGVVFTPSMLKNAEIYDGS